MTKEPSNDQVNTIRAIGIDVSKDKLDICLLYDDERKDRYLIIRNTEADLAKFIKNIGGYSGKTVMESTGRHHLLAAVLLSEDNLDVRVINPLLTQKYSKSSIRKTKTDQKDSYMLAEIALKEERLPFPFSAGRKTLSIRKKLSLIASLEKQLQQLSSMTNDYVKTKETLKLTLSRGEKQILSTIKQLRLEKDRLEQEVENDVKDLGDDSSSQIDRFSSIPGVSLFAATLTNFFFSLDHLESAKQWIAYSGLDVSVRESGCWRGRGKLTKRGNPFLRKRLYQAAWGATMHNEQFKDYYNHLKTRGRNHKEALNIIARKIIRIMFSLTKNQAEFDINKLSFIS